MTNIITVTVKEAALLNDIITSEYQDGDVVGHDIWFDYIVDSQAKGGVYASLLAKGLVTSSLSTRKTCGITESTIAITQQGFDAVAATETPATIALRVAHVGCTDARVALRAAEEAFDAARCRLSDDEPFAQYDRFGVVREALTRLESAMAVEEAAHHAYQQASAAVFADLTR